MPGDLMRHFVVTLAFIAQIAAASALPLSMSAEQAVSAPAFGSAAGNQQTLGVASSGQVGFAVWLDQRRGATDLYGSRIDPSGAALDPLGILIATGATGGNVIWNGTEFVVISERGSDKTFTFITTDGVITARKSVLLLYHVLAAKLGSGPEARILFIGLGRATIVDSSGNVIIANVQTGMPVSDSLRAAAGGTSEFLVLHTMLVPGTHLFAERIDRDGRVLSSAKDTGIDLSVSGTTLALAGADDDYLLVGRGPIERAVLGVHLDRNGVAKGAIKTFELADATTRVSLNPPATPAVLRDGDVYEVAWTTSEANGSAYTSLVLELAVPGVVVNPVVAHPLQWTGMGYRATLAAIGSHRIIITDALRSGVSTTIDPIAAMFEPDLTVVGPAFDLASSATRQTSPQIAAAASGYAVLWNEYGPDGATHLYLRRYLSAPLPGTIVPVEIASDATGRAIPAGIAASGDVYVIVWGASKTNSGSSNYVVRRIAARTGAWLDPEPVPLATAYELVLAANLDGALAVYNVDCSSARCLRARAIATDAGSPLRSAETKPASGAAYEPSLAGNGHEYLAAWNDNRCFFPCDVLLPSRILAQRIGPDGNAAGSAPIVLDDTQSFPANPSIAWDGSRYLVSWTRDASILGAHVSASGIADSAREIYRRPSQLLSQKLVASGGNTLLFLATQAGDASSTSVITIDPQSLVSFGELVPVALGQPPSSSMSIAVAPAGSLLLAYDRIDEADGFVGRVFTRAITSMPRRRAAR
jgi:hypothetical protein